MGTVIVCRDATEDEQMALAIARVRSQLEQRVHERTAELEAVNAKLRLVEFTVQQAPVATYWIARDARILRVNATACRMLGYRAEDLEQMPLASLDPAFPFERWEQSWDELRRVGHRTIETVHIALDGRHLPVEVDVCHLEFEGAEYHVAFARDISQRKLTESSLRASEERFRGTLDAMLEGCMIIGFDWRYRYVNEAAARHAGSTVDEVRSRSVFEVAPGIDQTSLFAVMRDCMDKRRSAKVEHEVRFAGGPTRWFELAIQAAPEGLFVLSLDITDRKRGAAAVPPNTAAIANRCRNRAGAPRAAPRYGWRR
jgi:PAS domain S-box-containing protein